MASEIEREVLLEGIKERVYSLASEILIDCPLGLKETTFISWGAMAYILAIRAYEDNQKLYKREFNKEMPFSKKYLLDSLDSEFSVLLKHLDTK